MSNNRYLEIDSSYRDRNQYPFPSDFVVEISQTGQLPRDKARDPVSNVAPTLYWNNSFLEDTVANTTAGGGGVISVDTTFSPSDPTYLKIVLGGGGNLRQIKDFYTGAVFSITVGGTPVLQRIISYEPLNATTALIRLASALPNGVPAADGVIQNPTPLPTNTASSVIKFFIPSGSNIDNYYANLFVQALGTTVAPESFLITSYDGITHLATLESATTNDWSSNGNANENFILRKELSISSGTLTQVSADGRIIQLATTASNTSGTYTSAFLRMVEPVPTIVTGFSVDTAPYAEERRINKYVATSGFFLAHGGVGTNTFTLDTTASNLDDTYVNSFITDTTTGEIRQIATYVGSTHSGTVTVNWGAGAIGDAYVIRTVFLQNPFSVNPVVGVVDAYEIEQFTRDNWNPFSYTGSLVSSQEMVCYEVELLNLVLPNTVLISGKGGRAIFYPYFYVELQQVSSSSGGMSNIIYSNNPNATKMLFRAIVDDTSLPVISPFIKIDGDGMVQIVKFKPNDSFHFSVRHANGELFKTQLTDYYSPESPNPLVQISACFGFKRI